MVNKTKKKRMDWLNKINNIRNIVSHPPKGGASDSELEYTKKIHKIIEDRMKTNGVK